MPDGRIAGDPLGQLHAFGRQPPFKKLFRPLVSEVEANLQINHRLADNAEAEMSRLDDPRMNRADWNFINSFAADWQKWKGRAVVLKVVRRRGIFEQREVIFRPERMSHERSRIRVMNGFDAEQVINLSLKA